MIHGKKTLIKFSIQPSDLLSKRVLYSCNSTYICYNHLMNTHPNDPLYGKTLKSILEFLVQEYGFTKLGESIKINCFISEPSISSSLKFLRKTPWAREKVEELYIATINSPSREK